MAGIEGLVRALREGDDEAAKAEAARVLSSLAYNNDANQVLIAEAGGVPLLVDLLRDANAKVKSVAAWTLGRLACDNGANQVLIAAAGAIVPLVELLRDGSMRAKEAAAWALRNLVRNNTSNKVRIAAAGGIPPLVELLRDGVCPCATVWVVDALRSLARNNDGNAIAIAVAIGFEALIQLARRGRVIFSKSPWVMDAGVPAKRKAALVVAALLRDSVPGFKSAPDDIKAAIGSYL